jgi:hypothetical protein
MDKLGIKDRIKMTSDFLNEIRPYDVRPTAPDPEHRFSLSTGSKDLLP